MTQDNKISIVEQFSNADFSSIPKIENEDMNKKVKYWNGYLCKNPATQEFKERVNNPTEAQLKNRFLEDCLFLKKDVEFKEVIKFCAYWFEVMKNGKYRFQMEKAFELNRRLTTWFSMDVKIQKGSEIINKPKIIDEF